MCVYLFCKLINLGYRRVGDDRLLLSFFSRKKERREEKQKQRKAKTEKTETERNKNKFFDETFISDLEFGFFCQDRNRVWHKVDI